MPAAATIAETPAATLARKIARISRRREEEHGGRASDVRRAARPLDRAGADRARGPVMTAEQHNEFVTRTVKAVGPELLDQGNFSAQMVALESLIAGLFALSVILAGKTPVQADTFLSALTHGVRGRLPALLERKP